MPNQIGIVTEGRNQVETLGNLTRTSNLRTVKTYPDGVDRGTRQTLPRRFGGPVGEPDKQVVSSALSRPAELI